ncbi:hypothetical protein CEXT_322461 [Caerostris extrusa]|uniref:Uncharacterized protein n=1 Tax=Caerostris extrusa TaxID=172846 RepID=A0AAV4RMI9_CAEEX|nr:hypothetical protein CEXT_322461 [Caerostris extrusa]
MSDRTLSEDKVIILISGKSSHLLPLIFPMLVKAISVSFENSIQTSRASPSCIRETRSPPSSELDVRPLTARIPMSAGRFLHAVAPTSIESSFLPIHTCWGTPDAYSDSSKLMLTVVALQIDKHSGFRVNIPQVHRVPFQSVVFPDVRFDAWGSPADIPPKLTSPLTRASFEKEMMGRKTTTEYKHNASRSHMSDANDR